MFVHNKNHIQNLFSPENLKIECNLSSSYFNYIKVFNFCHFFQFSDCLTWNYIAWLDYTVINNSD